MMIASPIVGGLLLWYLILPLADDPDFDPLSIWKTNQGSSSGSAGGDGASVGPEENSEQAFHYERAEEKYNKSADKSPLIVQRESTTDAAPAITSDAGSTTTNSTPQMPATHRIIPAGKADGSGVTEVTTNIVVTPVAAPARGEQKSSGHATAEKKSTVVTEAADAASGILASVPPDGDDPQDVPIDGGLGIAIAATIGYGASKMRKKKLIKVAE